MSEYFNNSTKRKDTIKNILKQLHEGKTIDEVKWQFAETFQELEESEIVQAEQLLIDEGMPVEEIQSLCDVHTAVFRDSLNKNSELQTPPGHPINTFQRENQAASAALMSLQLTIDLVKRKPSEENITAATSALEKIRELDKHYLRKENLLFPYLEKYQFSGPSNVMWGIHNEIRAGWKKLAQLLTNADYSAPGQLDTQVDAIFTPLETSIREMIYKEEKILFPAAWARLDRSDWASIRRQEEQVGYSFIKPIQPEEMNTQKETSKPRDETPVTSDVNASGMLNLHTGRLDISQIDLMLRTLPIDVTFVDEKDEVCFFSESKDRIFQRDAAIIGRKVQNCHPPKSMPIVQKILDDFRTGKREVAEFWIQMAGKFILIKYFPLNDEHGIYRGCLEVTQDVSPIRDLEGERRLLAEVS
jgi:DUF438 domain-containing protein